MRISSRTPEGHPANCPVCNAEFRIEPSPFLGDATCPRCNSLVWVVHLSTESHVYEAAQAKDIKDRVVTLAANLLGVAEEQVRENPTLILAESDSLDTAELLLELEEELSGKS